jgi:hypothetical protein
MGDGDEREKQNQGKKKRKRKEERITRGNQRAMPLHIMSPFVGR